MGHQRGLDLSELDAEAADFHLLVGSPQILVIVLVDLAGQITRAVEPGAGLVRMRHEARGVEFGPVQIATRQPRAGDEDLADLAPRHRAHGLAVEQEELEVRNGPPDQARPLFRIRGRERTIGDVHRRLRDPVHVDQMRMLAAALIPAGEAARIERFAAEDHQPQ